jgi:hypothetical protein
MSWPAAGFTLLLVIGLTPPARGQVDPMPAPKESSVPTPLYRTSFSRGEAVPGLSASPVIKLPFECASDGTVFISMMAVGAQVKPPNYAPPPLLFTAVSPAGRATTFPLDEVTQQRFDVREIDHYVAESSVIFLIKAASENKPTKQGYATTDGTKGEYDRNAADHHFYVVIFDRDGKHKKTEQIDDAFRLNHLGVFPSGMFLALAYDESDHSPKLAMLKDDGTLLKFLQIGKGDAPESMLRTQDGTGKGRALYIAPMELVPQGRSILVIQQKTSFPLLEVNEAGEIRPVHLRLAKDTQIEGIVPSDQNLFARVAPTTDGSIYELNAEDGRVLKRFKMSDGRPASGVACVHGGKFLSFDQGEGTLVPLIGNAELAASQEPVKEDEVAPPVK